MNYCAIDPGKNGGIAFQRENQDQASAIKMPATDRELLEILKSVQGTGRNIAFLEDLVKYAGTNMPSSAMAVYASSYGKIVGMLTALEFEIITTRPQAWMKAMALGNSTGKSKTEWKNHLKQKAEQRFPHIKVTLSTSDALLMLVAGMEGKL